MVLRTIKDKIPLTVKQKYRPALKKIPVVRKFLTKPFYEPSTASMELSEKGAVKKNWPQPLGNINFPAKIDPHYALNSVSSSLSPDHEELIIVLGSAMFSKQVFSYHHPKNNIISKYDQVSAVQYFKKGDEKKLRKVLRVLTDEEYLETFNLPNIKIYVDLTHCYKSVDSLVTYASLQNVFKEFENIKADVTYIASKESKDVLLKIRKRRLSNFKTRTLNISIEQAVCLRTSNPFIRSNREFKKVLGAKSRRVMVLGWRELLTNPVERGKFDQIAKAYPETKFDIYEPIWNLPLNAKTDIHDLPENCSIMGDLGYKSLFSSAGLYDLVFCLSGESFIQHERGKLMSLNLLLQGLPLFGNVQSIRNFVSTTAAKELVSYIYDGVAEFKLYLDKPELENIEKRLSSVLKCICEWPATIYEQILPLDNNEVAKPVVYEKGRVVITTHRLNHIENMVKNISVCQALGFPVTIVMNNLSYQDAQVLRESMEFNKIECDYFLDGKYGLGYGITQAVVQTDADFWLKIDDDDIYTPGHFFETYAALRIFQTRYCGRRIALYNFVEENTLYAHKSGAVFPSLKKNGRHVSGACMSGLTSLLRDFEIPRYTFYNMDVAYSQYLENYGEARFIGSPFFLYVQRYDNNMHTWRFDFKEWALESVDVGRMPFNIRDMDISVEDNAEKKEIDICFLHRALPGTIGYGAGTWVPQEALNSNYNIAEIIIKEPSQLDEPLVTNFSERQFTRLHIKDIDAEYLSSAFDYYLADAPAVFHIVNMSEIGVLTEILKDKYPTSKVVVEVRTPLLSKNLVRRKDMCDALLLADNIITPSEEVLNTWLADISFYDVANKVTFVEPSINVPASVDDKKLFAKTAAQRSSTEPLRMIYNGSISKKRKIRGMIASILPSLERDDVTLTLCSQESEFNKLYPALAGTKNLIFLGTVTNERMYEILSDHDVLLAWLPQNSLYEEAWSTKIIEGALLGIDVIASVTRGHQDMAVRGLFRYFYHNDSESFADVIGEIRNLSKTSRNQQRKLARIVAQEYTWSAKLDLYKNVWALPERDM